MAVYYVLVDDNGVECIDRIEEPPFSGHQTAEDIARNIATVYPDTIYFMFPETGE